MRTTVNLDDDVVVAVDDLRRERGVGVSEAINQLARAGLRRQYKRTPFRQRSAKIGLIGDVTNIAEVLGNLDDPSAR